MFELSLHEFFRLTNRVSNIQLSMSCDFLKQKYNPKHNDASSVLTKAVKDANMEKLSAGESCCKCFSLCIVSFPPPLCLSGNDALLAISLSCQCKVVILKIKNKISIDFKQAYYAVGNIFLS